MKNSAEPKILSIDTSCDETAVAVTAGVRILANVIASQAKLHAQFGGVEPGLARREHQKLIEPTIKKSLEEAKVIPTKLDAVAVTQGPGLAIALEVGIAKAKELAQQWEKPLLAVNHMEGHLLSAFAKDKQGEKGIDEPQFPALGLLVSGGHTELVLMEDFGSYELVGQTLDDAAGECFDKVARILGLGYPGGPALSKIAKAGNENAFHFPIPLRGTADFNFSFSGLKTAALYLSQELGDLSPEQKTDFAASFEKAAVAHLVDKLAKAAAQLKPKMILIGGGVINNRRLQEEIQKEMSHLQIPVHTPQGNDLLTDNAAMIGVAASFKFERGKFADLKSLERDPALSF